MAHSHFKTGANIDRLVAQNEQYHAANQYANTNKRMEQLASWHSGKYRELKCPTQLMKGYDIDANNTGKAQELHHEMALELKYAAKELCILRRAKLKSLLENERLQHEAELNSMGLAIQKDLF
uniref:Uncharacterized protein n=1 Tax=Pyramimonas obovata TaxID=1411642 RepID=A0A7S0QVP1_9CHLO|mmetsp:Transcript_14457/g.30925  ORF Transcript_14457/g.30925 Transcript_14457/m.30925 type:complete len:123 (+) Transcript_14457:133-501(+)|eukprot:CAMPEP_0118921234 /NCGR_PEP_ID=MMETSP1169-20130426/584_1 /TAXON_ID=36882 /ORGANISM="Pyramimonas obovata, Strain CCMP722" /LENGTH=122 /DNA_ID=CAMNT_0006861925 /DNA_START=125 /DNA_END=493 /DNA_ORIENTATION=+